MTLPKDSLQFSTPHLNVLTGCILLGRVKLLVTKVPFFFTLAGLVSELVAWLSVDSVVSLLLSSLLFAGFPCGEGVRAGVGGGESD